MLLLEDHADWEAAYVSSAFYRIADEGYEVKTVSLSKDKIHSSGGVCVVPDYELASTRLTRSCSDRRLIPALIA